MGFLVFIQTFQIRIFYGNVYFLRHLASEIKLIIVTDFDSHWVHYDFDLVSNKVKLSNKIHVRNYKYGKRNNL